MTLDEALLALDAGNDEHWTKEGLPRLDVLGKMVGDAVTRHEVTDIDPTFTRQNLLEDDAQIEAELSDESSDNDEQVAEVSDEQEDAVSGGENDREVELRETVQVLSDKIAALRQQITESQLEIVEIEKELVAAEQELADMQPKMSSQKSILEYIKSQNLMREERAKRSIELRRHIDPKLLQTKAPIDTAFARKTARGAKRPTRAPVGQ